MNRVRLIIGKHQMSGFDGLSDGDRFGHVDHKETFVACGGHYGWSLRPEGNPFANALPGFVEIPDYFSFVQLVNDEWAKRH